MHEMLPKAEQTRGGEFSTRISEEYETRDTMKGKNRLFRTDNQGIVTSTRKNVRERKKLYSKWNIRLSSIDTTLKERFFLEFPLLRATRARGSDVIMRKETN